jgi:5-(carboxyamino)imidazole ribonucleotide synthase
MTPLPFGSTIGILGGGQLGQMTALAAAPLGYRTHIFSPHDDEPAHLVTPFHTKGSFEDEAALAAFADAVDVVTLEWENVPLKALEFLEKRVPVFPGPNVLRIAQDRVLEKTFARDHNIGTTDFAVVHSAKELDAALKNFTRPCLLKSTRMGYDGHGQVFIKEDMTAQQAWDSMKAPVGILEAFVSFSSEVSVIVARSANGETATFPVVENRHKNQILDTTTAPAEISDDIAAEALALATKLTSDLQVVGLLAIEMFVLKEPNAKGQRVLMNEVAPRPHNSGHWTIDACPCSQYEQLVRAVTNRPLGPVAPHSRAVMQNLLGDDVLKADALMKNPSAHVHLYGKTGIREGRKMGHVTFLRGAW